MADNVTAPGTGTTFATDDIAGIHYPFTKLAFGPRETATEVQTSAPLPTSAINVVTAPQLASAVTAAAYTANQVIGGLLQFTGQPTTGVLTSVAAVIASGTYAGAIDLFVFNANPSASTVADRGALVILAADLPKLVGILHLTDFTAQGIQTIVQAQGVGQPYKLAAGTTIFAVAVLRGAVTLAATTDFTITLGNVQ